ncbi:hypothetical protein [Nocardia sp. NPDC050175]|uniref:hypothetical protein n=1 Tax=Nocardia sp. NPDC050175 TaxID=3364317 RepID=UPI0037BE0313
MENRESYVEFGLSALADRTGRIEERLRSLEVAVGAIRFDVGGLAADSADVLCLLRDIYGRR